MGSSKDVPTSVAKDIPMISTAGGREEGGDGRRGRERDGGYQVHTVMSYRLTFVLEVVFLDKVFVGQHSSSCSIRSGTTLQLLHVHQMDTKYGPNHCVGYLITTGMVKASFRDSPHNSHMHHCTCPACVHTYMRTCMHVSNMHIICK